MDVDATIVDLTDDGDRTVIGKGKGKRANVGASEAESDDEDARHLDVELEANYLAWVKGDDVARLIARVHRPQRVPFGLKRARLEEDRASETAVAEGSCLSGSTSLKIFSGTESSQSFSFKDLF